MERNSQHTTPLEIAEAGESLKEKLFLATPAGRAIVSRGKRFPNKTIIISTPRTIQ